MKFTSGPLFCFFVTLSICTGLAIEEGNDGSLGTVLLDSFDEELLSSAYYSRSCPNVEAIINTKVNQWVKKDPTLAAALLRLHFHDCTVRGCDGSILLNHKGSERRAYASKTLRGFEIIDDIKSEIEKQCPKTVSCADILTAAARDATVILGGPYWMVPYGRRDGKVSIDKEAGMVPMGHENITSLLELFQSKGLNVLDLVVLSGAHTIGRCTCGSIQDRLYRLQKGDQSVDSNYLNYLTRKCRWASEYVELDGTTPTTWDSQYFKNLQNHMGLLSTDQALYSDPRTSPLVNVLASTPYIFSHQFAASMSKLGSVLDSTSQDAGEIRISCSAVNPF